MALPLGGTVKHTSQYMLCGQKKKVGNGCCQCELELHCLRQLCNPGPSPDWLCKGVVPQFPS